MNINPACNDQDVDFLHEIGSRMAAADPLHEVLARIVEFATELVKCDSCLIYVLEGEELVLRASKNPHAEAVHRLKIPVGQGITGWVAKHGESVAVSQNAQQDPRFKFFHELPEDGYQAFLSVPVLSRGRLAGVINLQHRQPHSYNRRQARLISTIGFLVGAEMEMARLEVENCNLAHSSKHASCWSGQKAFFSANSAWMKNRPTWLCSAKAGKNANRSRKSLKPLSSATK